MQFYCIFYIHFYCIFTAFSLHFYCIFTAFLLHFHCIFHCQLPKAEWEYTENIEGMPLGDESTFKFCVMFLFKMRLNLYYLSMHFLLFYHSLSRMHLKYSGLLWNLIGNTDCFTVIASPYYPC